MKKRPMVLIFTGILFGTAVVWNIMSMTTAFYILAGICAIVVLLLNDSRYTLIIAGIVFGIFISIALKISMNLELSLINDVKEGYITGEVKEVSKTKRGKQALILKNNRLEGKILLYTPSGKKIVPGDVISFEGILEIWEDARNPGQFSSRHYYFSKKIYYHAYAKEIMVKRHRNTYISQMMMYCRTYLKKQLTIQYNEEVRDFLNAMMLGDKRELQDEVKDDFKESGLIHLLAVSGLHISLVGRGIYRWIRKFCGSFIIGSVFGIFTAVCYCILTGMSISSIRAVIMLGVYFLSEILGEHYDLLSSASFAGIIILVMHPYRIYDTGFLYSFAAVFVIGCYQMIKPQWRGNFQRLKEAILFCIFIQIGMFPMMIYFQYEAPIFSFAANVAALPLATTGFTMAFLLIFFPYTIFHRVVSFMIMVVLWISRQSYGIFTVGHVPVFWVILFYVILYLCVYRKIRICFLSRIVMIYVGVIILILVPMLRKKTMAFLDVGQGDCFVADTSAGLIVSDGGSSSEEEVGRYRILPYMKYLGYQNVKIAVISHMDTDHYSGIYELLKMGRIEYLGLADIPKDVAMKKLIKTADQTDTKIFYLSKGRKIVAKNTCLKILHPQKDSIMEKNAASIVMQGKVLGYKVLLTGDVEKEGEDQLLSQGLERVEILKAAHHGSKNSTSENFLQKTLPVQAVISCGKNNRYGHPHQETIHRLKRYGTKILRTDKMGAVIFKEKTDS